MSDRRQGGVEAIIERSGDRMGVGKRMRGVAAAREEEQPSGGGCLTIKWRSEVCRRRKVGQLREERREEQLRGEAECCR